MRFICLHGRATCAKKTSKLINSVQPLKTFEMQTSRIREDLSEHDFVFLNGDIMLNPADVPTMTSADPDGGMYAFVGKLTDAGQYQDLLDGLVDMVQNQGPFDAVMGFSEGGIIAATLLLEDARRPFASFKCGILFSAAPPLDPDDLRAGIVRCLDPAKDAVSVYVPTAHIYSHIDDSIRTGIPNLASPLDKLWDEAGWSTPEEVHGSLAQLCDKRQVFVHDGGHQVPGPGDHQALRGTLRAINRTIKSAEVN